MDKEDLMRDLAETIIAEAKRLQADMQMPAAEQDARLDDLERLILLRTLSGADAQVFPKG